MRLAIVALLTAMGCGDAGTRDNCQFRAQFRECMEALPAGPERTHYSDWDEVVMACESYAYNGTWKERRLIRPECR